MDDEDLDIEWCGCGSSSCYALRVERAREKKMEKERQRMRQSHRAQVNARDEGVPSLADILSDALKVMGRNIPFRNTPFLDMSGSMSPDTSTDREQFLAAMRRNREREAELVNRSRERMLAEEENARQRKASATINDNLKRATRRIQQARKALQGVNDPMLGGAVRVDLHRLRDLIDDVLDETR